MAYSVRAMPLARIASMPASATTSMPAWAAVSAMIPGVPTSQPPMPGRRSKRGPISNWSDCANQPWIGGRSSSWSSRRTYRKAGAPGPPLRYLYVQPTARSTPFAVELHRDRAGRVREVPQDERAGVARRVGHRPDVDDRRRAVVDGGEDQRAAVSGPKVEAIVVGREALDRVALEPADLEVLAPVPAPRRRTGPSGTRSARSRPCGARVARRARRPRRGTGSPSSSR